MKILQRSLRLRVFVCFLFFAFLQCFPTVASYAVTVNSLGDYDNIAVLEVVGDYSSLDISGGLNASARHEVSREFFRNHCDDFDFLVTFSTFDFSMPAPNVKAYLLPARNNVEGIGLDLYDSTNLFSADGEFLEHLEGLIEMGPVQNHVLEPSHPEFEKTLQAMIHEMVHRWAAYLRYMEAGEVKDDLLGPGQTHWSFLLDSAGSTLYGNHWQENGDGTFTTTAPEESFEGSFLGRLLSPLELYLMGLGNKSTVPPLTLIDSPGIDPERLPEVGVTIPGVVKQITIDQITAAMGERYPTARENKEFRMAFLLLVEPGNWDPGSPEAIHQLQLIGHLQKEWQQRFSILTDGAAVMQTELTEHSSSGGNPGVVSDVNTPHVNPHVNEGVSWLLARQEHDGSWLNLPGMEQRDTALAAAALFPFPAAETNVFSALDWLRASPFESTDALARRIMAGDLSLGDELSLQQNSDGGWGSAPGYRSNPVDTALVLHALTTRGGINTFALDGAINYLNTHQNLDGGWNAGFGVSMVQPTAYALLALNAYREDPGYTIEPAIAAGIGWLAAKQNVDGGFGNSTSTVYDTAAALVALKAVGSTQTVTDRAISYLLAKQAASGSWNGSVFQTAMAVSALHVGQIAVDLVIDAADISFNPSKLDSVPAVVTVTAHVGNLGSTDAPQVKVSFYDDNLATGTLIEEKLVDMPGTSRVPVDFVDTVTEYGVKSYSVVVDENNQIFEASEFNNSATRSLSANLSPPMVGFDLVSSRGAEAVADVLLSVSLSHAWLEQITVAYSVNGASTALPSDDYLLGNGTLTFAANETSKTISVTVVNDAVAETDKTVIVDLLTPSSGKLSNSQHTYTILDDELPEVNITSPPSGVVNDSTPALLYTTTGSDVVVKVDGSVVNKASGQSLDLLADGAHDVEVAATNDLGMSTVGRVNFTIDTSVAEIAISSPKGLVTDNNPLLQYSFDKSVANIQVLLDGVEIDKWSGQYLDPIADGEYTITVMAVSNGQQISASENFTIDTQPRALKLRYPYQNGVLEEVSPPLLYDVSGAGQINVLVDGVAVSTVSGELLDPLSDGEHHIQVTLSDAFGVRASDEATFVVELDPERPYVLDDSWSPPTENLGRRSDLAVDKDGNVFLAGMTSGVFPELFIAKYDKQGVKKNSRVPWPVHMETGATALGVDGTGNSYVAFTSFDGIQGNPAQGGRDVYLAKFSGDTGLIDIVQIATRDDDYVYDIYVTEDGLVYLAGLTGGRLFPGSSGGFSTWVAKYDSDLTTYGTQLNYRWGFQKTHSTYTEPGNCFVTVDVDGNVYVAGGTTGSFDYSGTTGGYYLAKWGASGTYYGRIQTGTGQGEIIEGIGTDAFGHVYLFGTTYGAFSGYANAGLQDAFVVKHTSLSSPEWVRQWGTSDLDEAYGLITEPDGDLYLLEQHALTKYDRNGNNIWTDSKLTANRFEEGGFAREGNGNLFAIYDLATSDTVYKYKDSRLPAITVDVTSLTNQQSIQMSGTVEAGASVSVTPDTGAVCSEIQYTDATNWSCTLSNLQEGINNLTVTAKTAEGFKSHIDKIVRLDTIPPAIYLYAPQEGATYSEKPTPDYLSGATSVTGYVNNYAINALDLPLQGLLFGENVFRLEATDAAGNKNSKEVSFIASGNAVGETPYEWMITNQSGTSSAEAVDQVVLDASGNVYLVGTTFGDLNGEPNNGQADVFVSKYDDLGTLLWTRLYGSADSEYGKGLVVDDLGNLYLLWEVHYASIKGKSQNWSDVLLAKYDDNNNLLWSNEISSTARDYAGGLDLDINGDIWVTGTTEGSIDRRELVGLSDYFFVKFDNNGNRTLLYTSMMEGDDAMNDVWCDEWGYAYLTGRNGNGEPYVARLKSDGTPSDFVNKDDLYTSPVEGEVHALRIGHGYTYLTGSVDHGQGTRKDIFFAKCDGAPISCTTQEFSTAGDDVVQAMSMDVEGNLFLVGYVEGEVFGQSWEGGRDVFLAKMNAEGQRVWTRLFGTPFDEEGAGVVALSADLVFVGGHTDGDLGGTSAGASDLFIVPISKQQGPSLTVAVTSPTNITDQLITGTVSPGATLTVKADEPAGSTAAVSPVIQTPDGTWSFTVSGMVPDASNVLSVIASDQSGSVSETVTIVVDTLPPSLLVDPVLSPFELNLQTVTGFVEPGASLYVETETADSPLLVTVSEDGRWRYDVALQEGVNPLVFTATDVVGNQAVIMTSVTATFPEPVDVSLSKEMIGRDETTEIFLTIANTVPGREYLVEEYLDANDDGNVDAGEPLVRVFVLIDEVASSDLNVPGDEALLANQSVENLIVTTLNYHYLGDVYHAEGKHLFRISHGQLEDSVSLLVAADSYSQVVTGFVVDDVGVGVPGAIVQARDKWDRIVGYAFSSLSGEYSLGIKEPGDYLLTLFSADKVCDKNLNPEVVVEPGAVLNMDLVLTGISNRQSGRILESSTSQPLSGVLIRAENDRYTAVGRTDLSGYYRLALPDGNYNLSVDTFSANGDCGQALYTSDAALLNTTISNENPIEEITLDSYQSACNWTARDQFGEPVPGVPVKFLANDDSGTVMYALSDGFGQFSVASGLSQEAWSGEVSINEEAAQVAGYVGTQFTFAKGDCTPRELTVYPVEASVSGRVLSSLGDPLENVPLVLRNALSGAVVRGLTAADGSYHLGVHAGEWSVAVDVSAYGVDDVHSKQVVVDFNQADVVDFTIDLPLPNSLSVTEATYTLRKQTLTVAVTSDYPNASLVAEYNGVIVPMLLERLFKDKYRWSLVAADVLVAPENVRITGPEGSITSKVIVR